MKKILLVEDDKALQKLIVYNFQKEGFNIETVIVNLLKTFFE